MGWITYFGYGSNMDRTSLSAKGVETESSEPAILSGWRLIFNMPTPFVSVEGTVASLEAGPPETHQVHGVLHRCDDSTLSVMDALEAEGVAYERREVEVVTYSGRRATCFAYFGLDHFTLEPLPTSQRYLDIIRRGAQAAGLAQEYIDTLRDVPVLPDPDHPDFRFPASPDRIVAQQELEQTPYLTALAGAVFDMRETEPRWVDIMQRIAGGRDSTLWILSRQEESDGTESKEEIAAGRLTPWQRRCLNNYLHEFARLFTYVGRLSYADNLPFS